MTAESAASRTGRRVIVHPGFHKTGTTTLQTYLFSNGPHIWPKSALLMPNRIRQDVSRAAVRYSRFGTPAALDVFRQALGAKLDELDLGLHRSLVISDENLSGRIPGRLGQEGYDAAPVLMETLVEVVKQKIGEDADIRFVYTLRDPKEWLRSAWFHSLRSTRLTLDLEEFSEVYGEVANLQNTVDAVAEAVAPYPVHGVRIEDLKDNPEGVAAPIIQLLALPEHLRSKLEPVEQRNVSPSMDHAPELLAINRSRKGKERVIEEKSDLLGYRVHHREPGL